MSHTPITIDAAEHIQALQETDTTPLHEEWPVIVLSRTAPFPEIVTGGEDTTEEWPVLVPAGKAEVVAVRPSARGLEIAPFPEVAPDVEATIEVVETTK